ncbi:hypothetical protein GCM10010211_29400 [Streptomyces albospinus]|uniref:Lipoprotein n=1 Tax=Streptomyces albospinus TaxID=285515 RepID=A0ABQ2V192_9ACTN|nr:hypothetical protein [Streptomyces albospinus]GGU62469.1 hypothetical protein GCM10010211_29400 [Streptomyces albospinus]
MTNRRTTLAATTLGALIALTACQPGARPSGDGTPGPRGTHHRAVLPENPTPCASRSSSPGPAAGPRRTKLAWRAEELPDGSLRMTVGDVDTAPKAPEAVRRADYRTPVDPTDCTDTTILAPHGWWCTTTVSRTVQDGDIVVGGATPRAHLRSAGFRTRCSGRTARMRQHYEVQRDSWSGWRPYSERGHTPWTAAQSQSGGAFATPCPRGRVGTYNYRLAVTVDVEGIGADASPAAGPEIRTDCGTGVS